MELARRRDSSVQRRAAAAAAAAAAASAERAASCAGDLMQRMIEDSATGSKEGPAAGALAVKNQPTENVSGGGMLDALGPVDLRCRFPPEFLQSWLMVKWKAKRTLR